MTLDKSVNILESEVFPFAKWELDQMISEGPHFQNLYMRKCKLNVYKIPNRERFIL